MDNRRYFLVLDDKLGGVLQICLNLMKYSNNIQYTVILLYNSGWKTESTESLIKAYAPKVAIYRIEYSVFSNKYHAFKELRDIISAEDILVVNDYLNLDIVNFLRLSNPLIFIVHNYNEKVFVQCEKYKGYIDKYIVVSQHILERLKQMIYEPNNIIAHIRHPLNLLEYPATVASKHHNNELTLIYIGRFSLHKGKAELIKIANGLYAANAQVKWIFISDGQHQQDFDQQLNYGIKREYYNMISNQEVLGLLAESNILVFPSHSEGFPISVVEAMALGVVPITYDLPSGIPELVVHDKTGFIVERYEFMNFIYIILYLVEKRDKLIAVARNANEHVKDLFNVYRNIDAYEEFLRETTFLRNKYPVYVGKTSLLDKWFVPNYISIALRRIKFLIRKKSYR